MYDPRNVCNCSPVDTA